MSRSHIRFSSLIALWVVPVAFLLLISNAMLTSGCIVHNCPVGGKRSGSETQPIRQCRSCGPRNLGSCVTETICCGRDIGCYIGTAESAACLLEILDDTPCQAVGQACGFNEEENGRCVARGICCKEQGCMMDNTCDN